VVAQVCFIFAICPIAGWRNGAGKEGVQAEKVMVDQNPARRE
jgi:hypothetical protein